MTRRFNRMEDPFDLAVKQKQYYHKNKLTEKVEFS